jgi:hypothetical protein
MTVNMEDKMDAQVDPVNVKPGEFPPVATSRDELLIEALRSAKRVSGLLNELSACLTVPEGGCTAPGGGEKMRDLLLRRFSDCSGVHLFIAANNIGIDLPPDLHDQSTDDDDYDPAP